MILEVKDLYTSYGHIHALRGVDLVMNEGEIISLIGANGAGKSTLLGSIAGIHPVRKGDIFFKGEKITKNRPHQLVKKGISMVVEGRGIFPRLSVEENIKIGAYIINNRQVVNNTMDKIYDLFPRLSERKHQQAGTLSGGEQQMLAIGRALMSQPKLLLLDEPSLGLAPKLVKIIFEMIQTINKEGISILLIEQNANLALSISDRTYVLENGEITLSGVSKDLRHHEGVKKAYLGEVLDNTSQEVIQSFQASSL